ncbi:transposase [Nocardia vinacea]|uniref:transposase n=1 Tax=Nocardia vinacea TaxID=96468 RepID=UPI003F4D5F97
MSLAGEHRRGHGIVYAALDRGRIEVARLRRALAAVPLPRAADGRLVLAVDIKHPANRRAATTPHRLKSLLPNCRGFWPWHRSRLYFDRCRAIILSRK